MLEVPTKKTSNNAGSHRDPKNVYFHICWKHHTSYADSRDDTIGCYFDASKCADRELARKYPTKHMHEAAKSKPVMSNGGLTRLNRLKSGRDVTGGRGNRADRKKPGRSRRTWSES